MVYGASPPPGPPSPAPEATGWRRQIGHLQHISGGDDGEVWGITPQREVRRWNDGEWQPVPGALKQLSVGSIDHIWGVDDQDRIFSWYGEWRQVPGQLTWVSAASDGAVWGCARDHSIHRWNGSGWDRIAGQLEFISVASRKEIWGVNRSREIFRWNGGGWDRRDGRAFIVSVGLRSGRVRAWCLGENALYEAWDGGTWEQRPGPLLQPSVGAQYVLGVNRDGEVHSWGYDLAKFNRPLVHRQGAWRWCSKCQGLVFGGHEGRGACPQRPLGTIVTTKVPHDLAASAEYALATAGGVGQPGWRWCHKCEGLFFGGGAGGKCAVGGAHDGSKSGAYTLIHNDPAALGQDHWRYCRKCDGLFFSGGGTNACPGGGAHDGSASGAYKVRMITG